MRALRLLTLCCSMACYMAPDTHPVREIEAVEAGVSHAPDAASGEGRPESDARSAPVVVDAGTHAQAPDATPPVVDLGCLTSNVCSAETPLCRAGACVGCAAHGDCARFAERPACGPSGACVLCTPDSKAACTGATPACDARTSRCVACTADADCPSEQRPACSDHSCGVCKDDGDCARFGKVCDDKSGSCVACRPSSEEIDCRSDRACDPRARECPGTACDPKRLTCTSKLRGSVGICQACSSDSECVQDHRCIPLFFGEGAARKELGTFCMKLAASNCTEPYRAPAIMRESVSGAAAAAYCGISELATSCAAIQALREDRDCNDASGCSAPGARCESVSFGATKTCTYSCSSNRECPSDVPCGTMEPSPYCGGP